jgi:hypothetical protein
MHSAKPSKQPGCCIAYALSSGLPDFIPVTHITNRMLVLLTRDDESNAEWIGERRETTSKLR